jgi:N-formylglutamate deformylase
MGATEMFSVHAPLLAAIPLVCDSPHSGTMYPADFRPALPRAALRAAEDTHVEALWGAAPAVGATLIEAHFPRSYLDVNRHLEDMDPALLDGAWPAPLTPSEKTRIGAGLIWRTVRNVPIYDRLLSVQEVEQRIERCYRPYHAALHDAVERSHATFGAVWHMNLHSMPNNAYERLQIKSTQPLADFVLGDRDGTTCDPSFVALMEDYLRGKGYTVARNDPYKGAQLIADIGRPALNRHSMQVEVRRPIYMNEETRERSADFETVQRDLTGLLRLLAAYVKEQAEVGGSIRSRVLF